MLDLNQGIVVDADADGLAVRCPFWANELLERLPDKRWSKAGRFWRVKLLRKNVEAVRKMKAEVPNVTFTDACERALANYEVKAKKAVSAGSFPSWYKFKTDPRKHQSAGYTYLYSKKVGFLYMGLQTGKSKTAIDILCARRMEGQIDGVLVLVKRTLRRNWLEQLELHCPLPWSGYLPDTGRVEQFRRWLKLKHDFKWMMVGWESLSQGAMGNLVMEYLRSGRIAIIGDESTYIANHKSSRSEWAYKFRDESEYRLALTGTPALEGPLNLFGQFRFLDPDIIGIDDYLAFRNRYAIMGGYMREVRPGVKVPTQVVGYQNLEELMNAIAPYTYQVLKEDAYDLPPKRFQHRRVELSKAQRSVYDMVRKKGVLQLRGRPEYVVQNVLELALRLQQITGGWAVEPREVKRIGADGNPKVKVVYDPVRLVEPEDNPKIIELCESVEEYKGKKQGLIWARFTPEIMDICVMLRKMGLRVAELHGKIPERERQPMINAFKKGDYDVLVGNPETGGMGYSMMNAEINTFFNNSFKAVDRVQAEDRNWGDGQKAKSVAVIDIIAENTIDEIVIGALEEKMDLSDYVKLKVKEVVATLMGDA